MTEDGMDDITAGETTYIYIYELLKVADVVCIHIICM